ncbi:cell division protein FtsQ [Tepidamorphus gemmatus]|uniref:Cell division protein FtsQ n=1 Tax=Tepidamorphus gemmatus TaxID=747076 RepID=A0A4R3MN96_9HYPH|nr:cell division protein FtsQ/DivIB [Tepidamorphus gemmatus]TCT13506.1 cell division protein FtsQ [Tepidamorphus gemmatus]
MQSLGGGLRRISDGGAGSQGGRRTIVYANLPRRRRWISPLGRLAARLGGWRPPARSGVWGAAAFLLATGVYGTVLGDHVSAVRHGVFVAVDYLTARSGFAISSVVITGQKEVNERDVLRALEIGESTSLLVFDPHWARRRLGEITWIKDASVQKLFPGTLVIDLAEREPFALWQIGGIVSLIDREGKVIAPLTEERFAGLPLVVGYGANRQAEALIDMVNRHPGLAARFRAAVRVADRRWNLLLDNGIEIRLPETGVEEALAGLADIDRQQGLLARDIIAVDLRLADRLVVRLSEQAAMQRKAALKSKDVQKRRESNT